MISSKIKRIVKTMRFYRWWLTTNGCLRSREDELDVLAKYLKEVHRRPACLFRFVEQGRQAGLCEEEAWTLTQACDGQAGEMRSYLLEMLFNG